VLPFNQTLSNSQKHDTLFALYHTYIYRSAVAEKAEKGELLCRGSGRNGTTRRQCDVMSCNLTRLYKTGWHHGNPQTEKPATNQATKTKTESCVDDITIWEVCQQHNNQPLNVVAPPQVQEGTVGLNQHLFLLSVGY
jgi:hypothetical protein